jgi:hypothetical protein
MAKKVKRAGKKRPRVPQTRLPQTVEESAMEAGLISVKYALPAGQRWWIKAIRSYDKGQARDAGIAIAYPKWEYQVAILRAPEFNEFVGVSNEELGPYSSSVEKFIGGYTRDTYVVLTGYTHRLENQTRPAMRLMIDFEGPTIQISFDDYHRRYNYYALTVELTLGGIPSGRQRIGW